MDLDSVRGSGGRGRPTLRDIAAAPPSRPPADIAVEPPMPRLEPLPDLAVPRTRPTPAPEEVRRTLARLVLAPVALPAMPALAVVDAPAVHDVLGDRASAVLPDVPRSPGDAVAEAWTAIEVDLTALRQVVGTARHGSPGMDVWTAVSYGAAQGWAGLRGPDASRTVTLVEVDGGDGTDRYRVVRDAGSLAPVALADGLRRAEPSELPKAGTAAVLAVQDVGRAGAAADRPPLVGSMTAFLTLGLVSPRVGVLEGVGGTRAFAVRDVATLGLTYDVARLDRAEALTFLRRLRDQLQDPSWVRVSVGADPGSRRTC